MRTAQKFWVFAAFSIAALNVQAAVVTDDCPACSTEQLEALAKPCTEGYSYITNFPAGKFYKICYTEDGSKKVFHWENPEPQYQHIFDAYNNVYKLNGHHQYLHAHIRVDIPTVEGVAAPSGSSGH